MLPVWTSVLLGLGIPGIGFSLWMFYRRRKREIASLVDEVRLNVRLLEAVLRQVEEKSFRNQQGLLDYVIPDHRVDFYFTRYRVLLPLSYLPGGVVSDVLLFYEKLERLADFFRRLADGEDVAAKVELEPPGRVPMTRTRVASWEIRAVAETNRARGEGILSRLTQKSATLVVSSIFQHLTGQWHGKSTARKTVADATGVRGAGRGGKASR